jgi:hypothetical protein
MKGYNKENNLDLKWMKRMNDFLKLRELILFMVIHAAGPDMLENPFGKRFIAKFESRIKNNIPFFDIDRVVKAVWNS